MATQRSVIRKTSLLLGLLYASFPLGIGLGDVLWRRDGTSMQGMAVAAGIVFASVVLAYNQGFEAGKLTSEPEGRRDAA